MQNRDRFLSVRLGPNHLQEGRVRHTIEKDGAIIDLPRAAALVLEYADDQWILYYLNSDKKIQTYWFAESLEDGYARARYEFEVKPEEWIEDYSS